MRFYRAASLGFFLLLAPTLALADASRLSPTTPHLAAPAPSPAPTAARTATPQARGNIVPPSTSVEATPVVVLKSEARAVLPSSINTSARPRTATDAAKASSGTVEGKAPIDRKSVV